MVSTSYWPPCVAMSVVTKASGGHDMASRSPQASPGWSSRPLRVGRDRLANDRIDQDVADLVVDAEPVEDLHHAMGQLFSQMLCLFLAGLQFYIPVRTLSPHSMAAAFV